MLPRCITILLAATLGAASPVAAEPENPMVESETWGDLRADVVGEAPILDGSALFDIDAPYRAHDAATVPIRISQAKGSNQRIVGLTLVVDENPAPVVAEFEFGPSMGRIELETRVRIDQYSNIRAIAQTEDGRLWMTGRFVKGAGGCSAPALKDMEAALASAGAIRMRFFDLAGDGATALSRLDLPRSQTAQRREAQVMIRHPNYSGMQRNQVTQLFIPAFYVDALDVYLGEERLIHMTGGISISEDPSLRFSFSQNGASAFRVIAHDTDGGRFEETFPIAKQES